MDYVFVCVNLYEIIYYCVNIDQIKMDYIDK